MYIGDGDLAEVNSHEPTLRLRAHSWQKLDTVHLSSFTSKTGTGSFSFDLLYFFIIVVNKL